jgi:LuxR family quorum-sensing system transcriptional regulator CciR
VRGAETDARPRLTDRQRDCLIWAGRGKGDWETNVILGITEDTVAQHISQACERYGVQKRTSLMIHTLFDGTIRPASSTAKQWSLRSTIRVRRTEPGLAAS